MMCGIFAYTGTTPPDPQLLQQVALAAGRRGPHGIGCYSRSPGGRWQGWRQLGPADDHLHQLADTAGPVMLGHTRLATCGDRTDPGQLQPTITPGQDAIAHNGVIRNPETLCAGAATDSIALAHAYHQLRQADVPPPVALEKVVAAADHISWAIVIADRDGSLWAHRHHHPLYAHRPAAGGGVYLCSQPLLPDNEMVPPGAASLIAGGGN